MSFQFNSATGKWDIYWFNFFVTECDSQDDAIRQTTHLNHQWGIE
jgi:hypothetical protein